MQGAEQSRTRPYTSPHFVVTVSLPGLVAGLKAI